MAQSSLFSTALHRRTFLTAATAFVCTAQGAEGASAKAPAPGPRDTCPVCGMFVARYPHWIAVVVFKDGKTAFFDGAKDFFKFVLDLSRYAPGQTHATLAVMAVTDYYSAELIDAADALYVLGSDVLGPMGHELLPQASDADAAEFSKDHKGKRIVRFGEVTPALLAALDDGRFE